MDFLKRFSRIKKSVLRYRCSKLSLKHIIKERKKNDREEKKYEEEMTKKCEEEK